MVLSKVVELILVRGFELNKAQEWLAQEPDKDNQVPLISPKSLKVETVLKSRVLSKINHLVLILGHGREFPNTANLLTCLE